ncbi:hypothetical protein HRG_013805 [Hirsutella rhossiliensis]
MTFSSRQNCYSLFTFDQDFIFFRGNYHKSTGQLLKGVVVLCLFSSLSIENVRLRLTGTLRLSYTDHRSSTRGVSSQKVAAASASTKLIKRLFALGIALLFRLLLSLSTSSSSLAI